VFLPPTDCVSETEKTLEDSSRLSAWLSRLGLSSRIAEYTSLLRSVNALSNSSSETVRPSSTSVSAGADGRVKAASQEFPTCRSFVPRPLPHVGLNTVMSMKRDSSAHSFARHGSANSSGTLPSGSKELNTISSSATQCQSRSLLSTGRSLVESEKSACSLSTADSSSKLCEPAMDVTPGPDSVFVSPSAATLEETSRRCSENVLPSASSSESLKSATIPSVFVSPHVESVFYPASVPGVETNCGVHKNSDLTVGDSTRCFSSSPSDRRKTSTPAKRPQSLDVIPWSPLSRSACTLTDTVSTVVHSHVSSCSSNDTAAAQQPILASPISIPSV